MIIAIKTWIINAPNVKHDIKAVQHLLISGSNDLSVAELVSEANHAVAKSFIAVETAILQLHVALVAPGEVDVVLSAIQLPELGFDLVPIWPTLNMKNFTHFLERERVGSKVREMEKRNGYDDDFSGYEE
ncbi:hypothetical protein PVL29_000930 [Vitis rotundifolia]|uniref:Uncharacterized protein n=1 Tax=Vitis rotundifolia TaxID=103349 RepID=A0AA39AKE4_VITRO|nr:hypothetical protein PVL29_000930 [Vitis rotundifolia]